MCELTRLSVTRSIRRLYRLLGWLGLTFLDTRGEHVTPSRWRKVYNVLVIFIVSALQLWVGYLGMVLTFNKSSIVSMSLETVTRCILFVSLVHAFNRPALLKALDRTTDVINFRLTYEKVKNDASIIDGCLVAMFVFHLVQDIWFFMNISKFQFVDRVFHYYNIPVDATWIAVMFSYIMARGPTLMTSIFRVLIVKMYVELGFRFKILHCRLRRIRYELDASKRNTRTHHRSLFHITRAMDAHAVVHGAVREVADIMQIPFLAMTMHLMSKILISTFLFIVNCREIILSNGKIMKMSYLSLGLLFAVNVIHILWFIAISEPCNKIIDMDHELCSLVAECLRRVPPAEAEMHVNALESLRRVVEERTASALHFNVMGIYEIDRLMLVKIIGIVSTYLILLIQYQ